MLPLHHVRAWQIASIVFLILVLVATLMPAFWLWDDRFEALAALKSIDKWVHGFAFFSLAVWFAGLYRPRSYWRIGLGLLLFGLLIEACQRMVGYRTADWLDVGADAAGIIAGLLLGVAGLGGWCLRIEERLAIRQSEN